MRIVTGHAGPTHGAVRVDRLEVAFVIRRHFTFHDLAEFDDLRQHLPFVIRRGRILGIQRPEADQPVAKRRITETQAARRFTQKLCGQRQRFVMCPLFRRIYNQHGFHAFNHVLCIKRPVGLNHPVKVIGRGSCGNALDGQSLSVERPSCSKPQHKDHGV